MLRAKDRSLADRPNVSLASFFLSNSPEVRMCGRGTTTIGLTAAQAIQDCESNSISMQVLVLHEPRTEVLA